MSGTMRTGRWGASRSWRDGADIEYLRNEHHWVPLAGRKIVQ